MSISYQSWLLILKSKSVPLRRERAAYRNVSLRTVKVQWQMPFHPASCIITEAAKAHGLKCLKPVRITQTGHLYARNLNISAGKKISSGLKLIVLCFPPQCTFSQDI
ncbi:hypothetical protein RRG08_009125 [Elysia crispata]|uniref:Uncharacterized protein n=1 Tax=Elysia crispata TaxID=231223 RepID=A0AAE1D266_9GAST|nr:hypothetical protein RRG08_009125 [Elysia crispata]